MIHIHFLLYHLWSVQVLTRSCIESHSHDAFTFPPRGFCRRASAAEVASPFPASLSACRDVDWQPGNAARQACGVWRLIGCRRRVNDRATASAELYVSAQSGVSRGLFLCCHSTARRKCSSYTSGENDSLHLRPCFFQSSRLSKRVTWSENMAADYFSLQSVPHRKKKSSCVLIDLKNKRMRNKLQNTHILVCRFLLFCCLFVVLLFQSF